MNRTVISVSLLAVITAAACSPKTAEADAGAAPMPVAEASDPATCPQGHENAVRLLSVFASVGASSGSAAPAPAPRSGGGCGSGCGCAH